MIKLLRVDHRLIHGQVALSWTNTIGADSILVANDTVINDPLQKATLKMACPHNIKVVIKNVKDSIQAIQSGKTDKYKLFIVVGSIEDAYKIIQEVPEITRLNLGGTKAKEGTKNISKAINVTEEEERMLKELAKNNISVEIQQVPTDSITYYK